MKMARRSVVVMAGLVMAGSPAMAADLALGALAPVAQVDERFQSYNVEMVEVTGGRFWAPYGGPPGERYRQRPPIDLASPRLRALARALGPAFARVSGTWSNNSYVAGKGETVAAPPPGFAQVLQRDQWRAVVDFAKAVDAGIVTSFAASTGTRDAAGNWQPAQAQRLVDLTREAGGTLAAAEFFNEPNAPTAAQGMPASYTAADYGRDFKRFRDWARTAVPGMRIIGPGSVGEGTMMKAAVSAGPLGRLVSSADMLAANPGSLDAVSYHFYGSVSQRCAGLGIPTPEKDQALSPAWLDRTLIELDHYAALRDQFEPGKPIWNTETAQAACGGSPWAATFLDSFRYLNQNAVLARRGVQVVMHNTLAASDYALIDQETLQPRPNYWAALLWRRTMGQVVLAPPVSPAPDLRLHAQCLAGGRGGVALMLMNTGTAAQTQF
ncbi:MAG: hypothetical protein WCO82_05225, partial [Sphingomonadales bacterium]